MSSFIPFSTPEIDDSEINEVIDTLRSGWITTGPKVKKFESDFQDFIGSGVEAVAVNSATAGLHLALEALGVGEGDEVILKMAADAKLVRNTGANSAHLSGKLEPYCLGEKEGRLKFFYDGGRPNSLDEIPYPAYDLLDENVLQGYLDTPVWGQASQNSSATPFTMNKSISTVSSRGCPFACRFCFRGAQGERNYSIRSARNLAGEMRHYIDTYNEK